MGAGAVVPPPPPPQRSQDLQEAAKSGDETEAEEDEVDEEGGRGGDTPRGARVDMVRVGGGDFTPRRNTRIYLTLPLNMHTCCYGEFMETSHITTMACT